MWIKECTHREMFGLFSQQDDFYPHLLQKKTVVKTTEYIIISMFLLFFWCFSYQRTWNENLFNNIFPEYVKNMDSNNKCNYEKFSVLFIYRITKPFQQFLYILTFHVCFTNFILYFESHSNSSKAILILSIHFVEIISRFIYCISHCSVDDIDLHNIFSKLSLEIKCAIYL